jgi:hypothetical protein
MDYIRLRRRPLWSAGASEARPRFGSLGVEFSHSQSAVAATLCRRTPKVGVSPILCGSAALRCMAGLQLHLNGVRLHGCGLSRSPLTCRPRDSCCPLLSRALISTESIFKASGSFSIS